MRIKMADVFQIFLQVWLEHSVSLSKPVPWTDVIFHCLAILLSGRRRVVKLYVSWLEWMADPARETREYGKEQSWGFQAASRSMPLRNLKPWLSLGIYTVSLLRTKQDSLLRSNCFIVVPLAFGSGSNLDVREFSLDQRKILLELRQHGLQLVA